MSELTATVDDLSHDGFAVCKVDERVYFVDGGLPGERIRFLPLRKRKGKFGGQLVSVETASPDRVQADCVYFGTCGGCAIQHLSRPAQIRFKQDVLLQNLQRIGRVEPEDVMSPLVGDDWHYRRKARPGVKHVPKKGGILVGFRERGNSFLTSLRDCLTLDKSLSVLLDPLHELITELGNNHRIPQIEMASGDNATALVLRHLEDLTESDHERLTAFAIEHNIQMFLQPGKLDSVHPLWPLDPQPLHFVLPDFDVTLEFAPSDFIQVNGLVNRKMVATAMHLLEPKEGDRILDLFSGLGNFTLPLARSGASVTGVEGDAELVRKGNLNAQRNLLENAVFEKADLHKAEDVARLEAASFDKMLIDPPRSGAREVCEILVPKLNPQKLLYISCNPATLARDADYLVNQHGYRLRHAGIADMFPHTAHVESIALFERS